MTNKHELVALHLANPAWTARQLSDALGCLPAYVYVTARRNGLTLPLHKPRHERKFGLFVYGDVIDILRVEAEARSTRPSYLARLLLQRVLEDGLVSAVLDDGDDK
jgi:hypothetical protein